MGIAEDAGPSETEHRGGGPTLLWVLLGERHWRQFRTFEAQFGRAARELAQREEEPGLAGLTVSEATFERWAFGKMKRGPLPDACRVLEHMFGFPVQQLLRRTGVPEDIPGTVTVQAENINEEDPEEVERRRLLQSLAALGVTVSPLNQALETVRTAFGATVGYDERDHLDSWENSVVEYGYSYMSAAPHVLVPELASDLVTIRSIFREVPSQSPEYAGWCRVAGALAALLAKSLSHLGEPGESRHWWTMAQHMTDTAKDPELGLWVRGQRIIHGLYENRPSPVLLRQVESAVSYARDFTCAGQASVSVGGAQASALSGDYKSAEKWIHRAADILERLPANVTSDTHSVMGWGEAQLRYSETWVYAHLGDEVKTDRAADSALKLHPRTASRSHAQIKLMQALTRVRSGNVTEGIQFARDTYLQVPSQHRTTMIDTLAQRVLASVHDEARKRTAVTEYRELIAPSAGKTF